MLKEQIQAELRLFKSFTNSQEDYNITENEKEALNQQMLEAGIFIDKPGDIVNEQVIGSAIEMYGIKPEQWNNTFHKSFSTVRDTPIEKLIAQQLIHYFTTYGFEELGLYQKDLVYIPVEDLQIPEYTLVGNIEKISFNVIHSITVDELKEKLLTLLTSGIALSKQTIDDVMCLSDYIDKNKFDDIKNKEVKVALYDKYEVAPKNPTMFLRYVVYKATGNTLLINNTDTIQTIKKSCIDLTLPYFKDYTKTKTGFKKLGKIFFRYKNLFLAFKRKRGGVDDNISYKNINYIINKIRKYASKYHEPVQPKILDTLTQIHTIKELQSKKEDILKELDNVTIFKEVGIYNGLNYRVNSDNNVILYKIRNGKAWVEDITDWGISSIKENTQKKLCDIILNHLVKRVNKVVAGKSIYLPKEINYVVPTSEKQFNGNIPQGSYIEINRDDNMVLGIHWKNVNNNRVDLDLHAQNRDAQFGWNTSIRSTTEDQFYFTGDITDACGEYGATELFYIAKTLNTKAFLLTVNNYSSPSGEIPFEFLVASCSEDSVNKNYVVDPNKVIVSLPNSFKNEYERMKVLGFIKVTNDSIRLYFNDFSLGGSIITRQTNITRGAFDYLYTYTDLQLKLRDLLERCDVTFLDNPTEETFEEVEHINDDGTKETLYRRITKQADINLSLNDIDKTSLIKIFGGK